MKELIKTISILTAGLLFTACNSDEATGPVDIHSQLTTQESRSLQESDGFGDKFFNTAVTVNPEGNLLVSPFGAEVMLGMLANATDEATTEEIISVIGSDDLPGLNSALAKISTNLPVADRNTKVTSANSIWYNEKETLLESFRSALDATYGAVFYSTNFSNPEGACRKINAWCSEKTNGLIPEPFRPEFIERINVLLVNALYFNGKWSDPFKASNTKRAVFHGAKSDSQIQMMNKKYDTTVSYYDNCRVVRIPFGDKVFFIDLILPDEGVDCNDAILNRNLIQEKKVTLTLALPRFELKPDETSISDIYKALGCKKLVESSSMKIFEGKTLNSPLTFQKATLKLSEEGVEAAAVTYSGDLMAAGPLDNKDTMVFDRPFALVIGETSTGVTLFAGRVTDI